MLEALQRFIHQWIGRGADFDKAYGYQCVDIVQFFNRDVNGGPFLSGANALAIWNTPPAMYEKIVNDPTNYPQPGDIIFFRFNHVAIVVLADVMSMTTLDQNYPTGSLCSLTQHDYSQCLGWWRKK